MLHQPTQPRHRRNRRERSLQPPQAAPQDRLVAADSWLSEQALDIRNRFDLGRVGATKEYPVGVGAVVFFRQLGPLLWRDPAETSGFEAHRHVPPRMDLRWLKVIDNALVATVWGD